MLSKAHVSYGTQADVEESDDAHPQIQNGDEFLRPLHLILQGKNLHTHRDRKTATLLSEVNVTNDLWVTLSFDI